jgi:PAS domain S-box-containing protein
MDKTKKTKALTVLCKMTFAEVKPLMEIAQFPIVVLDTPTKIMGVIDERRFWRHSALAGWETTIAEAACINYLLLQDENELFDLDASHAEFFVLADTDGSYRVFTADEIKIGSLQHRHEALINISAVFQKELDMLYQQNHELKRILDSSYDEIFVTDGNGDVLYVSGESCKRFTGFPPEVFLGKNIKELVEKGFVRNSVTLKVLETKSIVSHQQVYPNGKTVLATGKPVFNEHGMLHLIIINSRDITELVELRNQIAHANSVIDRQQKLMSESQSNPFFVRMITRSEKMLPLIELVEKVAPTDSSVLIEGESGVGKSILARMIHDASNRREKNFVQLNCGAIPSALMESELFGYEGGSFTGANKKGKPGLVELAEGGTLFLDEIGEMPFDLQVKLLQLVQEKTFVSVGGTKLKKVDIRIISATNKNLKQQIEDKTFREDLYYRLHVVPMVIPPLRERPDDVLLLVDHFLKHFNQKYSQSVCLTDATLQVLLGYDWPGNVRELENLIEQLVVTAKSSLLDLEDLPAHIRKSKKIEVPRVLVSGILPLYEAVEETEKQIMKRAIEKYKTSRKVAKALQVNQTTVIRKIHKYNLSWQEEEMMGK